MQNQQDYHSQIQNQQQQIERNRSSSLLFGIATMCGIGLIFYISLNYLVGVALQIFDTEHILEDAFLSYFLDSLVAIVSTIIPFWFIFKFLSKRPTVPKTMQLSFPKRSDVPVLLSFACLGLCMASNIFTGWFVTFFSYLDVELSSPQLIYPSGIGGLLTVLLRVSVVAALTEEFIFRGVIMRVLQPFGYTYSIVVSAAIFAIVHGNLVQAPFAFIVGLGLGVLCTATGSLWPSIIVHALNNAISILAYYLSSFGLDEKICGIINAYTIYGVLAAGLICFIIFSKKYGPLRFRKSNSALSKWQKFSRFFFNPAVFLVIAYAIYITSYYVS